MTYGERRKRADVKQILRDMDKLESVFLSKTQKLNKKRQEQLLKRVERLLPEIESAFDKGDKEELKGLLYSIQIPSQKEWRKNIHSLCLSSAKAGVLRAHVELMKLKELYTFNDYDWDVNVIKEGSDYDVIFPPEAQDWIQKYGYEIGVITEETARERIRESIEAGLIGGYRGRDITALVQRTTGSWLGDFHAETIARTETAKMYNAGRIARWSDPELNGFVEALQYDAIVDTRTTDFCRTIDGKIISMENTQAIAQYTPPNHFRCRATWIPVTQFEDWKDDFPLGEKPPKGFQFEAPLPNMLKGKKEPLVQIKPEVKIDPRTLTDPDLIRNLSDHDFEIAIGNITDQKLKLGMIQERAEKMFIADDIFVWDKGNLEFQWLGYDKDLLTGTFEARDKKYDFFMSDAIEDDVYDLLQVLKYKDKAQVEKILHDFTVKHASSIHHLDVVRAFRDANFAIKEYAFKGKGLVKLPPKSIDGKKKATIKTPPMTKNYKEAVGLQKAVVDGQQFIDDFIPDKWSPVETVRVRYDHSNRRAFARGAEIHFGPTEKRAGVVVHEYGHVLHGSNGSIQDMTHIWFMKRTDDLKMASSSRMGEKVIADSFFNSYIGRIYGWEGKHGDIYKSRGNIKHGIYGQEVISMGLQAMYENPYGFYNDDKDHFLFIYALMKGLF